MNQPVPYRKLHERLLVAGLIPSDGATGEPGPMVHEVVCDSRAVNAGSCFVAIRGTRTDGNEYVQDAIARGAVLVVSEQPAVPTADQAVAHLQVTHAQKALAICASALHGDPADDLQCIGVTGSNGKTSTAWLMHKALSALGEPSGLIGTVTYTFGAWSEQASLTTPAAPDLQRMLRHMVSAGSRWCVMEVSSHALDQRRVHGIGFGTAVYTNLQHDHLDYHKTNTAYARAKKRLFEGLGAEATAVTNIDDAHGRAMVAGTSAQVVSYGQDADADVRFEVKSDTSCGLTLSLDGQEFRTRLHGTFNAYNLAAGYAALCANGLKPSAVRDALSTAPPAPGRFEQLQFGDGTQVIVDYAHTPDALEAALAATRHLAGNAVLWCLFGCGGDRDKAKRPKMGAVAERLADHVIVTSDNTRSEAYRSIAEDIRRGMKRASRAQWIEDRREAVAYAARAMRPGDVLVVAGKGHEMMQDVGGQRRPLQDRDLVMESFAAREYVS